MDVGKTLDSAEWREAHWRYFAIFSANFFLDGVLYSIAPLILYLIVPREYGLIVASISSLAFVAGTILFGKLADIYGRRFVFLLSLLIEMASAILLIFLYRDIIAVTLLVSLINFGIGGEFGASYASMAEITPPKHRGKVMMLTTNFWNIGAAVIASISLIAVQIATDIDSQIRIIIFSALAMILLVALTRIFLPESPRWLIVKGRVEDARRMIKMLTGREIDIDTATSPRSSNIYSSSQMGFASVVRRYRLRIFILATAQITQLLTYIMVAYYTPYAQGFIYGIESAPLIILAANVGASIGAFILAPLIDRTRILSLIKAFAGGFITSLIILMLHNAIAPPLTLFLLVVLINMVFSEWAWVSLVVLEGELFPTGVRASIVGFINMLSGISSFIVLYSAIYISAPMFLAIASILWGAGLLSSIMWRIYGVESANRSVEELASS
jgi:MFS family permease